MEGCAAARPRPRGEPRRLPPAAGHHEGRLWVRTPHMQPGEAVPAPPADAVRGPTISFGPWRVRITRCAQGSSLGPGADTSDVARPAAALGLWEVLSGRFAYVLPVHERYAIGSTDRVVVPALRALGKAWQALVLATPQVVGCGAEMGGRAAVTVEVWFVAPERA